LNPKILITGAPRSGKSTLIKKLIDHFHQVGDFSIEGFLTPEVRLNNKRIGFDIEDIFTNRIIPFARVDNHNSKAKLGKYSIFIKNLDNYLLSLNIPNENSHYIYIIDEIGRMELFSKVFEVIINNLFSSDCNIIATIGQRLKHPIKNFITKLPNLQRFILSRDNQQEVFNNIISIFH